MRVFLAIGLPEEIRAALARLQAELTVGRSVPAENLHLTLAFAGEQPDRMVDEMHLSLQALHGPAPEICLAGLDTFGEVTPRVIFAGVRRNDDLGELHRRVRARLYGCGLRLPHERFRPHVTLARFRPGLPQPDQERLGHFLSVHGDFTAAPFRADRLTLFESNRGRSGSVYQALADYPLG